MKYPSRPLFLVFASLLAFSQIHGEEAPKVAPEATPDVYEQFMKDCSGQLPTDPRAELKQFQEAPLKPVLAPISVFTDSDLATSLHPDMFKEFENILIAYRRNPQNVGKRLHASLEMDVALHFYDIKPAEFTLCVKEKKASLEQETKTNQQSLEKLSPEERTQAEAVIRENEDLLRAEVLALTCLKEMSLVSSTFMMEAPEKKAKLEKSFAKVLESYQTNFGPTTFGDWYPRSGRYSSSTALVPENTVGLSYFVEAQSKANESWRANIEQRSAHYKNKNAGEAPPHTILYDKPLREDVTALIMNEALSLNDSVFYSTAQMSAAWDERIRELTSSSRNHAIRIWANSRPLYTKIRDYLVNVKGLNEAEIDKLDLSETSKRVDKAEIQKAIQDIIKKEIALKTEEYVGTKSVADSTIYKDSKAEQNAFKRREEAKQAVTARKDWMSLSEEEKAASVNKAFGPEGHGGLPWWNEDAKRVYGPWVGTPEISGQPIKLGPIAITEEKLWEQAINNPNSTCGERYKILSQLPRSVLHKYTHGSRLPGKGYKELYELSPAQELYISQCVEAHALNAFKHTPAEGLNAEQMRIELHKWHKDYLSKIDGCATYATLNTQALRTVAQEKVDEAMKEIVSREAAYSIRAFAARGLDPNTPLTDNERGAFLFARSKPYYRHNDDFSKTNFSDQLFAADQKAAEATRAEWASKGKNLQAKYGLTFSDSKDLRLLDYKKMSPAQLRALLADKSALEDLGKLSGELWTTDLINLRLFDAYHQQREAYQRDPTKNPPPARPPLLMMGNTVINIRPGDFASLTQAEKDKYWQEQQTMNKKQMDEFWKKRRAIEAKQKRGEFITPEEFDTLYNYDKMAAEQNKARAGLQSHYFKTEYFTPAEYEKKVNATMDEMYKSMDAHDKDLLEKSDKRKGFFYGARKTWNLLVGDENPPDEAHKDAKWKKFLNEAGWEGRLSFELGMNGRGVDPSLIKTAGFDNLLDKTRCQAGAVNRLTISGSQMLAESQGNIAQSNQVIDQILKANDEEADKAVTKFCTEVAITAAVSVATAGVGGVLLRAGTIGARSLMAARAAAVASRVGYTSLKAQRYLQPLARAGTVLEGSAGVAANTGKAFHTLFTAGSSGLYRPAVTSAFWTGGKVGTFAHLIMMPAFTTGFTAVNEATSRFSRGVRDSIWGHDPKVPPDLPFGQAYTKSLEGALGDSLGNPVSGARNALMAVGVGSLTQFFFTRGIAKNFTQQELDDLLVNIRGMTPQQAQQQLASSIASNKLSPEMATGLLNKLHKLNSHANWKAGLSVAAGMQVYELPKTIIERNKMQKELEAELKKDMKGMVSAEQYVTKQKIEELEMQLDKMWHDYFWGSFTGDVLFARATQSFGAMMPKQSLTPEAFRRSALNRALQRATSVNVVETSAHMNAPADRRARMFLTRDAYESYIADIDNLVSQVPLEKRDSVRSMFHVHTTRDGASAQPIKAGGKEYFVVEIPNLGAVERVFIRDVAMPINADIQLRPGESTRSLRSDALAVRDRGWKETLSTKEQAALELGMAYEEKMFGAKSGNLIDILNRANQRRAAQGQPQGAGAAP